MVLNLEHVVREKLAKEWKEGRIARPFLTVLINLRAKKALEEITDYLFYPRDQSINDGISQP